MKMVRSLLLGTAAGFLAVAGAQAADLPVKAKPVQYVKICDLYGAGYYYVPGTDTCIKIGGLFRVNAYYNAQGGFVPYGQTGLNQYSFFNRANTPAGPHTSSFRARFWWSLDLRTQTAYGLMRTYWLGGHETRQPADGGGNRISVQRIFIQLAGFTVGRAVSAFDIADVISSLTNNMATNISTQVSAITGIETFGYTAQFGNGLSASFSVDNTSIRSKPVFNTTVGNLGLSTSGAATSSGRGFNNNSGIPDFTANINLTQAWGQAQVSVGLHNIDANYWNGVNNASPAGPNGYGWAVGAGILVTQIPGMPGDLFGISGGYYSGAPGFFNASGGNLDVVKNNKVTFSPMLEAVYAPGTSLQKTTGWALITGYSHRWTPTLKTSIWGSYFTQKYSGAANALLCAPGFAARMGASAGSAVTLTNCDFSGSLLHIGSRVFQWTVVPNLDIGLDIVYTRVNSNLAGFTTSAFGGNAGGVARPFGDNNMWSANLQVIRTFWP